MFYNIYNYGTSYNRIFKSFLEIRSGDLLTIKNIKNYKLIFKRED